jgi:hypothetical protein
MHLTTNTVAPCQRPYSNAVATYQNHWPKANVFPEARRRVSGSNRRNVQDICGQVVAGKVWDRTGREYAIGPGVPPTENHRLSKSADFERHCSEGYDAAWKMPLRIPDGDSE